MIAARDPIANIQRQAVMHGHINSASALQILQLLLRLLVQLVLLGGRIIIDCGDFVTTTERASIGHLAGTIRIIVDDKTIPQITLAQADHMVGTPVILRDGKINQIGIDRIIMGDNRLGIHPYRAVNLLKHEFQIIRCQHPADAIICGAIPVKLERWNGFRGIRADLEHVRQANTGQQVRQHLIHRAGHLQIILP